MQKEFAMFRSLARLSDIWFTLLFVGIGAAFIAFGLTFLCVQLVTVLLSLVQVSTGLDIYLAAALASLLVVPPLWWFFIIKPRRLTIGQGAFVGFLASLAVHPLTWLFALLFSFMQHEEGVIPGDPISTLIFLSFASLILVGWMTLPLGALTGAGFVAIQRRLHCQARWSAVL